MIISGGVNIYPAEIEAVLHEHPADPRRRGVRHPRRRVGRARARDRAGEAGRDHRPRRARARSSTSASAATSARASYEVRDELPRTDVRQAAQARAARRVLDRSRDRCLMRPRALVAGALIVAAVVVLVVAFTSGSSGADAQATTGAAVATPLWSVRRFPEPVVEAVGAQHLQSALDAAAPGDGTCFVVSAGNHVLATHGADTPLIGASTQKLLVAAAALSVLGPDTTFQTRAVASRRARRRDRRPGVARRRRRPRARHRRLRRVRPVAAQDQGRRHHQPRGVGRRDRRQGRARHPRRRRRRRLPLRPAALRADLEGHLPHRRRGGPAERTDRQRRVQHAGRRRARCRSTIRRATRPPSSPSCCGRAACRWAHRARVPRRGTRSRSRAVSSPAARATWCTRCSRRATTSPRRCSPRSWACTRRSRARPAPGIAAITAKLKELGVPVADGALKDGSGLDRGNRVTCANLVAALTLAAASRVRHAVRRPPGRRSQRHAGRRVHRHAARGQFPRARPAPSTASPASPASSTSDGASSSRSSTTGSSARPRAR